MVFLSFVALLALPHLHATEFSKVKPIITQHCTSCHANGGPRTDHYPDGLDFRDLLENPLAKDSKAIWKRMAPRIQATKYTMPPGNEKRDELTQKDINTIVDWIVENVDPNARKKSEKEQELDLELEAESN